MYQQIKYYVQECEQQLISVSELVSLQTGLSPDRQMFVVSENKRRFRGYGAAARDLAHSWTVRRSTRSVVIGMVNFVFLPEVVSRLASCACHERLPFVHNLEETL